MSEWPKTEWWKGERCRVQVQGANAKAPSAKHQAQSPMHNMQYALYKPRAQKRELFSKESPKSNHSTVLPRPKTKVWVIDTAIRVHIQYTCTCYYLLSCYSANLFFIVHSLFVSCSWFVYILLYFVLHTLYFVLCTMYSTFHIYGICIWHKA